MSQQRVVELVHYLQAYTMLVCLEEYFSDCPLVFCLKAPEVKVNQPEAKVIQPEVKEESPAVVPVKEEPAAAPAAPQPVPPSASAPPPDEMLLKNHEPHLGPKPRSHNKVLNPPGGKSSVVFY